jgi:hypothetical protein
MCKFASQSISIACALILPVMLTLNLGTAFAQSNTYRCTAKDAVGIEPDGTVTKKDPGAKIKIKEFWRVVIDVKSGNVTFPSSGTLEHRVVEKAGDSGDYVLLPSYSFRFKQTPANATTDFIRLHAGTGQQLTTFRAYSLTYLVTGTCEIVR